MIEDLVEPKAVLRLDHLLNRGEQQVALMNLILNSLGFEQLHGNFGANGMSHKVDFDMFRDKLFDKFDFMLDLSSQIVQVFVAFKGRNNQLQLFFWLIVT